jgi:hypothetical protein
MAAAAHADPRPPLETWLPLLRPGMWIKVEGRPEQAGGLRVLEIKVLHGDRDESEVTTTIRTIDAEHRSFSTRLGIGVETNARSRVQGVMKVRSSFSALRVGDRVEAEGQLQKNGTLLADEIEIKRQEQGEADDDEEITGRIESVDAAARKAVVLGTQIFFDERTKNKSRFPD